MIFFQFQKFYAPNTPEYGRSIFINAFSILFCIVVVFFAFYNFYVTQNYPLVLVHSSAFIGLIITLYFLNTKPNINYASYSFVALILFVMTLFTIFSQKENYSLVWSIAVPMNAFYLLGSRKGMLVTSAYMIFLFGYLSFGNDELNLNSQINIFVSLIILSFILYFFEKSREAIFRELFRLSTTDRLSNLYNRLQMEREYSKIFSKSVCSVVMIDIDNFKNINDTYGHHFGDKVIVHFSQLLRSMRNPDIKIGRWGGEEFIIATSYTKENTEVFAQELQNRLALDDSLEQKYTVSIGIAQKQEKDTQDSLINRADEMMYKAKIAGKNCIKVY